jgi:hypothetical protein
LAAFLLADFSVGFFLAFAGFAAAFLDALVFFVVRVERFTAFFRAPAGLRTAVFLRAAACLRGVFFSAADTRLAVFLAFFTAFDAAFFLPPRFFALAIPASCSSAFNDSLPLHIHAHTQ